MAEQRRAGRNTGKRKRRPRFIKKFNARMRTKLMVLFSFIVVVLILMGSRIFYMTSVKGEEYNKRLLANQNYGSKIIPYQRGDIVDTNGSLIATSVVEYNMILDSKLLHDNEAFYKPVMKAVEENFSDYELDMEKVVAYYNENPNSQYRVIAKGIPYSKMRDFEAYLENNIVNEAGEQLASNLKVVWFEKLYRRMYPMNSLAASVIGFTNVKGEGALGLELYYNDVLSGVNGREYGFLNSENNVEKSVISPEAGNTVVSTIDANIQSIVEDKIDEFYKKYSCNVRLGGGFDHCAVLVMDPNSGAVKAMANGPTFDLNNSSSLDAYFTKAEQAGMTDTEKGDFLFDLWNNYCITSSFEPGSVQKPLTVACGLDIGQINTGMEFYCDGKEIISDRTIKCVATRGHKTQTLSDALRNSCNDSLMQISYLLGVGNFTNYQSIYGFGQKTGIDLPGESSCAGLVRSADTMSKVDLATNAFGQNFNCTMIQMASAFSSIINGGTYYQPFVVRKILDSKGNTISTMEPQAVKQTVSASTSEIIRDLLQHVVDDGTGRHAKVDGYSMGGKTGTAEKLGRNKIDYVVSFMGYVPKDDPQVLIYCVLDRPNVADQSHSYYAQNIVREILEEILPYMNIYPDEEKTGVNANLDITGSNPPEYTVIIPKNSIWDKNRDELKEENNTGTDDTAQKPADTTADPNDEGAEDDDFWEESPVKEDKGDAAPGEDVDDQGNGASHDGGDEYKDQEV